MKILLMTKNAALQQVVANELAAVGLPLDVTVSLTDMHERMEMGRIDIVIIDDAEGVDGAYGLVQSITEAAQAAEGPGYTFYEPENIWVITDAQQAHSVGLGAKIFRPDNLIVLGNEALDVVIEIANL